MSLLYRRLVYLTFIAVFLITAPILIMYALGYRFDFKKTKFQRTGSLSVTTIPHGATVELDGVLSPDQTPLQIDKLLPADYLVSIKKDGYYPWTKRLTVAPEKVTFVKDLFLFKNEQLPWLILEGKITNCQPSPNYQLYGCIQQKTDANSLIVINLATKQITELYTAADQITDLAWAASSKKILLTSQIAQQLQYLVIEYNSSAPPLNLKQIIAEPLSQVRWDVQSDNQLYGKNARQQLCKIELAVQKADCLPFIIAGNYLVKNNLLYYLQTEKNQTTSQLLEQDLDKPTVEPTIITSIADLASPGFLTAPTGYLLLLDSEKEKLFLINEQTKETALKGTAQQIFWSQNQADLIYYNNFEIWRYHLATNSKELIVRYGQPIQEVVWHPAYQHLLLIKKAADQPAQLLALGLDQRDNFNLIQLAEMTEMKNLVIEPQGNQLYFVGEIGQQEGVYELVIH